MQKQHGALNIDSSEEIDEGNGASPSQQRLSVNFSIPPATSGAVTVDSGTQCDFMPTSRKDLPKHARTVQPESATTRPESSWIPVSLLSALGATKADAGSEVVITSSNPGPEVEQEGFGADDRGKRMGNVQNHGVEDVVGSIYDLMVQAREQTCSCDGSTRSKTFVAGGPEEGQLAVDGPLTSTTAVPFQQQVQDISESVQSRQLRYQPRSTMRVLESNLSSPARQRRRADDGDGVKRPDTKVRARTLPLSRRSFSPVCEHESPSRPRTVIRLRISNYEEGCSRDSKESTARAGAAAQASNNATATRLPLEHTAKQHARPPTSPASLRPQTTNRGNSNSNSSTDPLGRI